MAITTLKGIVKELRPIETYGESSNPGKKQTVVIFIPGYTDQWTGEKKGPDEEWGIDIFNEKIQEHGLNVNCVDKKVELEVRLRGRSYDRTDGGKGFSIGATLRSIKILEDAGTSFKEGAF